MAESILDVLDELYPDERPEAGQADTFSSSTSGGSGERDERLQRYLAEVAGTSSSLLALVSFDTGEQGRECGGGRIDFDHDPVSGHKQSFSYYLNADGTESWKCFSASNATGREGGTLLDYLLATGRASDNREAVRWLLDATGHQKKEKPSSDQKGEGKGNVARLPKWNVVLATNPPKRRPVLIDGLLRRGHVMVITGKAKAGKTWLLINLSCCIAARLRWLRFQCEQGNVLYVDPELDPLSLNRRFKTVSEALGIDPAEVERHVSKWCLRGVRLANGDAPTIADVAHDLRTRRDAGEIDGDTFSLVCIDSASALLAGDENASGDVRRFFNACNEIAEITGASVVLTHHMGKGARGDFDAIERGRGSSVWGDAPDAPLSLTEIFPTSGEPSDFLQSGERAFMLEDSGLREFPSMEPLHIVFGYPTHKLDANGITDDWKPKTSQGKGGGESGKTRAALAVANAACANAALLAHLYSEGINDPEGLTTTEAAKVVSKALGKNVSTKTLRGYLEGSSWLMVWKKSPRKHYVVPLHLPSKEEQADIKKTEQQAIQLE